mmetsp:Transcript_53031/g.113888  ORF Transcript_53031/g.113888 Transcript_53031/m.113888 type:complete len:258 (-) Transcript_53031:291-1064(-)
MFLGGATGMLELGASQSGVGYSHTRMQAIPVQGFEREGTAELTNDPRFFTENVIDKRLAAFEALAIVTEIMAAEAVKQCFELPKDFELVGPYFHVAVIQLAGFFLMCAVMFAATMATAVLSLQLFFTIRLMTAGPTGFDKAARFYTSRIMWIWRERAIYGVKFSLVSFTLATGLMLYVKFYQGGVGEEEMHREMKEPIEVLAHKIIAAIVLVVFLVLTAIIAWLCKTHQSVFDECYSTIDTCHPGDLATHLMSIRGA